MSKVAVAGEPIVSAALRGGRVMLNFDYPDEEAADDLFRIFCDYLKEGGPFELAFDGKPIPNRAPDQ